MRNKLNIGDYVIFLNKKRSNKIEENYKICIYKEIAKIIDFFEGYWLISFEKKELNTISVEITIKDCSDKIKSYKKFKNLMNCQSNEIRLITEYYKLEKFIKG